MDPSSLETHVENVGGNCVIVTTLMSSTAASQTPETFLYSSNKDKVRPVYDSNVHCPASLPLSPEQTSSVQLDETMTGAFKKADHVFSCRETSHDNGLSDSRQHENHWKSSNDVVSMDEQALMPMDTNLVSSSSWTVKRSPQLGPLVVVKQPRRTNDVERVSSLTEVEIMSQQHEIDKLRSQLKTLNDRLEEVQSQAEEKFQERVQQFEEKCREEERRNRRQFQENLSVLRVENDELTNRVKSMEEDAGCAARCVQEKMQNEWSHRFAESESQWKQRLVKSQKQWEDCVNAQVREKREALQQVQELAVVVTELEMTLQQVTREKCWVEQQREALLSDRCQGNRMTVSVKGEEEKGAKVELTHELQEVLTLRRALKEAEGREKALMVQLEAYGKEMAVQEEKSEKQLHQLRKELEYERRRGSDVVGLYSSQIESLHRQLRDALGRNKQLTKELAKFQGR